VPLPGQVLTQMGSDRLTEEEADTMLKLADNDGDGVLDFDEIRDMLTRNRNTIEMESAEIIKAPESAGF
jgi:Ca2+-binding EF-hand superfamily protein